MQNKLLSKKRYYSGRKPETEHTHDLQWPHLLSSDLGLLLASSESAALKASSFCSYSSLQWKELSVGVLGLRSILPWWIENLAKKKKSYPALTGLLVKRRGGNAAEKYTCWTRVKHVISVYSPSTNSFFFFKYISICFSQTFCQNLSVAVFFFPCSTYAGYTEEAIVFFFYNNPLLNLITFNCYYLDAEGCSVSLLPSIVIQ